jgi:tetratricopeptide (TPR) repeat protein
VLDGTLQAGASELRVTARLTDAESGAVVWSDRWARPAEDVFAVQDEIVDRIGGTLDGTWTGKLARVVRAGAEDRPVRSLEAYELYLLGADAKHQFTPEAFAEAVAHLRRALEIDPDFVPAMVTLSIVLLYQADLTPDEAEAAAMAAEAFRLGERAVEIDPDDPNALLRLSCVRVLQGRRADGWPFAARAVEIAPTNPDVLAVAAWCYFFADQDQSPLDWAERALALNPSHPDWYNVPLAMTALFAGDLDLARRAAVEAPPMPDVLVTRGAAEALAGDVEEARAWFGRFEAETRYRSLSALYSLDDMGADPAWGPWVEGARLAGFPVTKAEADRADTR